MSAIWHGGRRVRGGTKTGPTSGVRMYCAGEANTFAGSGKLYTTKIKLMMSVRSHSVHLHLNNFIFSIIFCLCICHKIKQTNYIYVERCLLNDTYDLPT